MFGLACLKKKDFEQFYTVKIVFAWIEPVENYLIGTFNM